MCATQLIAVIAGHSEMVPEIRLHLEFAEIHDGTRRSTGMAQSVVSLELMC